MFFFREGFSQYGAFGKQPYIDAVSAQLADGLTPSAGRATSGSGSMSLEITGGKRQYSNGILLRYNDGCRVYDQRYSAEALMELLSYGEQSGVVLKTILAPKASFFDNLDFMKMLTIDAGQAFPAGTEQTEASLISFSRN